MAGTGMTAGKAQAYPQQITARNLTPDDLDGLYNSFISDEIIEAVGIYRVGEEAGAEIAGQKRNNGRRFSGLIFPYCVAGTSIIRERVLRRDMPDMERNEAGELKEKMKYIFPRGRSNMLYFPPWIISDQLSDSTLPCVITEGAKKALALLRLSTAEYDGFRFLPLAVSGVWNWRGTVGKTSDAQGARVDVNGPVADLDLIQWQGRSVVILYDSNVRTNQSVWSARQRLARELEGRGANVLYAELPIDCDVNGIDDYLGQIERRQGEQAAVAEGLRLLGKAVPFGTALPLFTDPPKPLDQTLRAVAAVDPACLPLVLRDWVIPAAKVIGCPQDFLILPSIILAGSLIGPRVRIRPFQNSNWFVVPNMYGGIVGLPSSKKSPALDEARKPILRLQAAARKEYQQLKEDYEIDLRFFEKSDKEAKTKSKSASEYRTKLGLIDKPQKPNMKRFETNDATSQKMLQFLEENPNGVALVRDELIGWLKSLEAEYDSNARSLYLELWKGAVTYDQSRVGGNRETYVGSGTLSIVGGIQPSKLQHYISEAYSHDNADGFPQRFLFAYPDLVRQTYKPTSNDFNQLEHGLEAACATYATLAYKEFGGNTKSDAGDIFLSIAFDPAAQEMFDDWKGEVDARSIKIEAENEVFASFLNKLAKNCAAIALTFHCLENININPFPDAIGSQTMLKALAYIEVMTTHAERVFALGENRIFALAQMLLGKIKAGKLSNGFTARDLKRKHWSGLQSTEIIQDVLAVLIDYRYLKTIDTEQGRPTAKYYIHPSIEVEVSDEVE